MDPDNLFFDTLRRTPASAISQFEYPEERDLNEAEGRIAELEARLEAGERVRKILVEAIAWVVSPAMGRQAAPPPEAPAAPPPEAPAEPQPDAESVASCLDFAEPPQLEGRSLAAHIGRRALILHQFQAALENAPGLTLVELAQRSASHYKTLYWHNKALKARLAPLAAQVAKDRAPNPQAAL